MPILDFWVAQLHHAGFEAAIVNAFHLSEELTAEVRRRVWPIPVHVEVEPVLLGTGGGIRNVRDFFDGEPLVVINGDIVCKVDWAEIMDGYFRSGAPACLIVHDCPAFNNVAVDKGGMILGFGEDAYRMERSGEDVQLLAFTGDSSHGPPGFWTVLLEVSRLTYSLSTGSLSGKDIRPGC